MRSLAVLTSLALVAGVAPGVSAASGTSAAAAGASARAIAPAITIPLTLQPKLGRGLAGLVTGDRSLDPRIPGLVAGYRAGEIPYFVTLTEPNDDAHRAALEARGARILRRYKTMRLFAVASQPADVLRVAELPWVSKLTPLEVVVGANHQREGDQRRGTPVDVGANKWWDQGITGRGIRIAILDTGIDPTHPDVDDLDFRHWSNPVNPGKIYDSRNFNGGQCTPTGSFDAHGHGTHVAGIAAGTGEGSPSASDDGKHTGIAPGATLAVGKALTDAGAGINSDLLAALEWAAMPLGSDACAAGAHVVNLSLGSEVRPDRMNSDHDVDLISEMLNNLAVRYGTLFVVAAGNSGPFIGSVLEAPGSAAQALTVAAAAKDYDVNHDDTASGDACAGWKHPNPADPHCAAGVGTQRRSLSTFGSHGPSEGAWLKPDLVAPGYNIVSAQSTQGAALAANDFAINTRADPFYATATGTSMASPAAAGSAALLLNAYRQRYSVNPTGAGGLDGVRAPAYVLLRAAMMNTATADLYDARWILSVDFATHLECPVEVRPLVPDFCAFEEEIDAALAAGKSSLAVYNERNGATDPYVGPFGEGAGKVSISRAIGALRDGLVIYSGASRTGGRAGTWHTDFQGSWSMGSLSAGETNVKPFVLHAAPSTEPLTVSFQFTGGHPSDTSRPIPVSGTGAWRVRLPATTTVPPGGDVKVDFSATVGAGAAPGAYSGAVIARVSNGQVLRIPVMAVVPLHDADPVLGRISGSQATDRSAMDVYAKGDTVWPSVVGTPGTGANADWIAYRVQLQPGLGQVRFSVYDAAAGDETYDLYLYDEVTLVASTHPFLTPGVTDTDRNAERGPSTRTAPQTLVLKGPKRSHYVLVVNRAKVGGTTTGDFGRYVLTIDEAK